jgi:hypothetical protein
MTIPKKSPQSQIRRAAAVNGFSPKAADALVKWCAGGAASNAWLDEYIKRAGLPSNQSAG